MFFVVFESVTPASKEEASTEYYLKLQKLLDKQEGFISETPYGSASDATKGLVVARFEDEDAAHRWRKQPVHLHIQKKSRSEIFSDYRIRAGPEIRLTSEMAPVPEEQPSNGETQTLVLLEHNRDDSTKIVDLDALRAGAGSEKLVDAAAYENQTILQIISWQTTEAALKFISAASLTSGTSVSCIKVTRDYGKDARTEAPQDADKDQAKAENESTETN